MKKLIVTSGILIIIIVTVCNFWKDDITKIVYYALNKKDYTEIKENIYYLEDHFNFVDNYKEEVNSSQDIINFIYYIVNSGATFSNGYCSKEYTNCINDLMAISNNSNLLSTINNFVHPFNSFKSISFTYNEQGYFKLELEHVYTEEEINKINIIVDKVIKEKTNNKMTSREKLKAIHNYIIDTTDYDKLKSDNIEDTTYKSNTAYGVLIEHYGICSGYSDAYAIFLDKLNVINYKISNDTHIWNLVYLNGLWLHVDLTWDDPISNTNLNRDSYFLINTKELVDLKDETHSFDKIIFSEVV